MAHLLRAGIFHPDNGRSLGQSLTHFEHKFLLRVFTTPGRHEDNKDGDDGEDCEWEQVLHMHPPFQRYKGTITGVLISSKLAGRQFLFGTRTPLAFRLRSNSAIAPTPVMTARLGGPPVRFVPCFSRYRIRSVQLGDAEPTKTTLMNSTAPSGIQLLMKVVQ